MKDLVELMIEMNKLTKQQIAVDLSEADKQELLSVLDNTDYSSNQIDVPSTEVAFQNCIDIPSNISVTPKEREFAFQSCLNCITGESVSVPITPPNCPQIEAILFPIKIIGCIQYMAVADVSFANGCYVKIKNNIITNESICPSAPPTSTLTGLSVFGCICVDKIVGYTSKESCFSTSIPCTSIGVCLDPFTASSGKLTFSGKFLLPNITDCSSIPGCTSANCPV